MTSMPSRATLAPAATAAGGPPSRAPDGLDGVVVADTRLSRVDGESGRLLLAGYPVESLAGAVPWEAVLHLLWWDRLPSEEELSELRFRMASHRPLGQGMRQALSAAAAQGATPIDAMMMACAASPAAAPPAGDESSAGGRGSSAGAGEGAEGWEAALALAARLPVALAAYHRLHSGRDPLPARAELGVAGNLLWQMSGRRPSEARTAALDAYLVTTADHGFNASTFTARVIAATGAAAHAALAGAIGALSGWRHGGAPGPVLDMLEQIERPEHARAWLEERLARGERIMGFGHRVYRVRDPRAAVLRKALERLLEAEPPDPAFERRLALAEVVEREALVALRRAKPDRRLHTNVEFATALLLSGLGLEAPLFTPMFAVARTAGWLAHAREAASERLLRPRARYVGATRRPLPPARASVA